jgi:RimJ/RimL family protein N-acetyltransferase
VGEALSADRIEVRPADPRDLDALVAISLACGRSHRSWAGSDWSPPVVVDERKLWWDRLSGGASRVAVAEAGLTRVGCVVVWRARRRGADPRLGHVTGPLVDPDWWGEGIGRLLHDEALAMLARLRFRRAELTVEAGNRRARRFLEHRGWERTESGLARSAVATVTYARRIEPPGLGLTGA